MITFLTIYKNASQLREETTINYLEHVNNHVSMAQSLEFIICDYGSTDDIKTLLEDYPNITYLYIEPNKGEFLNMAKCLNGGCFVAKNSIIAPFGIDMRVNPMSIDRICKTFFSLGDIVLRPTMIKWGKNNQPEHMTYTPYLMRRHIIMELGGWDERMVGWGREDDDIMERALKYEDNYEVKLRGVGFGYGHVWHKTDYADINDKQEENPNAVFARQNAEDNGKNMVNSYWKRQN